MIIHFLRTFHLLRNTSNYVWSPSFLPHRMSWNMQPRSLISRAAAWTCAQDSGLRAGGEPWAVTPLSCPCSPAKGGQQDHRHMRGPWKDSVTW